MAKPALKVVRNDSFASLISELGTSGDKRESAFFVYESFPADMLEEMYAQSDVAGRICDDLPETMFREGFDLEFPGESESASMSDEICNVLDELDLNEVAIEAIAMMRATGGALILVGANDGTADPKEPLREDRIQEIEWLSVLTRGAVRPYKYYTDWQSPKYGLPEIYEIINVNAASSIILSPAGTPSGEVVGQGQLIHESRIVRVDGYRIPKRLRRQRQGWGGATLERSYRVLRDFDMSWSSVGLLMQEIGLGTFKMEGLAQLVNAGNNDVIVNRARQIAIGKSTARSIVMDAKEQFERISHNLVGVPEVLQQFALRLAASAQMPVTRLMGQSPAGLNATGESDITGWYDFAKTQQQRIARPIVMRVAKLVMLSKRGPTNGKEPKSYWAKWPALWQMSEEEKAKVMMDAAIAHEKWIVNQVLDPDEIATSCFTGEGFQLDIHLDLATRAKIAGAYEDGVDPAADGTHAPQVAVSDPKVGPQPASGQMVGSVTPNPLPNVRLNAMPQPATPGAEMEAMTKRARQMMVAKMGPLENLTDEDLATLLVGNSGWPGEMEYLALSDEVRRRGLSYDDLRNILPTL